MKVIQFDSNFIINHMDELIHLEDYVPEVSFIVYEKQNERDDFLKSKNLLTTIQEMDYVLNEKCKHYKNPIRAHDTIIIEWLDCHPEFEGIIAKESLEQYQKLKQVYEDFTFINLLSSVKLPFEEKPEPIFEFREDVSFKDDSHRMFPNFKAIDEIFDKYSASLLACYLSDFV